VKFEGVNVSWLTVVIPVGGRIYPGDLLTETLPADGEPKSHRNRVQPAAERVCKNKTLKNLVQHSMNATVGT
jgi:hypothetical protein